MKKIIAATDFSVNAANAIRYATEMAVATNAQLHILHVYQPPLSYSDLAFTDSNNLIAAAEQELAELKNYFEKLTHGRLYISTEVRKGDFIDELQETCKRVAPYLVIIGARGKNSVERFFLGSHAIRTMKQLKWPVIAVPNEAQFSAIKKIGLACDLNEVAESIPVDEIKLLINNFQAELHIINSGKEIEFNPEELDQSMVLRELLESLRPAFHFIVNKSGDSAILEFAETNQIDLLIIIPKDHKLIDRLVHRSHTRNMVLQSHVPIMSLHVQDRV